MFETLKKHTNFETVPQVFIGGQFVGGYDDVNEKQINGELKDLLANYKVEHNPEAVEVDKMANIANKFSFFKGLLWVQKIPLFSTTIVTGVSCYFGGWWGLCAIPPALFLSAQVNKRI